MSSLTVCNSVSQPAGIDNGSVYFCICYPILNGYGNKKMTTTHIAFN